MNKTFKTLITVLSLSFVSTPSFADEVNSQNPELIQKNGFETTIFGLPLNEGPIDRTIRITVGLGLLGAGIYGLATNSIKQEISWSMVGVSALPLATGASGYCPAYQVFGLKYSF